ncbi:MAG: GAF domain-containing protein [bacterium]|nr:GAF domain-containing protein [bacterium]
MMQYGDAKSEFLDYEINRENLTASIFEGISRGDFLWVSGAPGCGKTILLNQVRRKAPSATPPFTCIYIPLGAIEFSFHKQFYGTLGEHFPGQWRELQVSPLDSKQALKSLLDKILSQQLPNAPHFLIILEDIDRIPVFLADELLSIFSALKPSVQQGQSIPPEVSKFSVVISSSSSSAPPSMQSFAVPVLSPEEGGQLIDNIMKVSGVSIDSAAKERILQNSGGNPNLISLLCSDSVSFPESGVVTMQSLSDSREHLHECVPKFPFLFSLIQGLEKCRDEFQLLASILHSDLFTVSPSFSDDHGFNLNLSNIFVKTDGIVGIRFPFIEEILSHYFDDIRTADILALNGKWGAALSVYKKIPHDALQIKRKSRRVSFSWRRKSDIIKAIVEQMYTPELEPAQILDFLMDGLYYIFTYDSVNLFAVDKERNFLSLSKSRGLKPEGLEFEWENDSLQLEVCALSNREFRVENSSENQNFAAAFPLQLGGHDQGGGGSIGEWCLSLHNRASRESIDSFEIDNIKSFVDDTISALKNIHDYYRLHLDEKAILDAMGEEVSIIDRNYKILYVNRIKREKIGSAHLGETCFEVFAKRDEPCEQCPCMEAMKSAKTIRDDKYHVEYHAGGHERFVVQTSSPILDKSADGQHCTRAVNICRDNTRQKKLFDTIERLQKESSYQKTPGHEGVAVQVQMDSTAPRSTVLNRLISIIMDGIVALGYRRVRYYSFIKKSESSDAFIIGRDSRGMEDCPISFAGYRINLSDILTFETSIGEGSPRFYFGDVSHPGLKDKQWVKDLGLKNVKWMEVPLLSGEEIVGFIAVDNFNDGEELTSEDLNLMAILAIYSSQSLANYKHLLSLDTLFQISQKITLDMDIDVLLSVITSSICRALQSEMCAFFLFDKRFNALVRQATCINRNNTLDYSADVNEMYDLNSTIFKTIFQAGKTKIIDDFEENGNSSYVNAKVFRDILESGVLKNAIIVPLKYKTDKIGAIIAGNRLEQDGGLSPIPFSNEELLLLRSIGDQAASVISNARLRETLGKTIEHMEVLTDITKLMLKNEDHNVKLYFILVALIIQTGLGFNNAIIFLSDPEGKVLKGTQIKRRNPDSIDNSNFINKNEPSWEEFKEWTDSHDIKAFIDRTYSYDNGILGNFIFVANEPVVETCHDNILTKAFNEKKLLLHKQYEHNIYEDYDPANDPFLKTVNGRKWAVVPMMVGNKVIGVIYVDNRYSPIDNQRKQALVLLANQASIALYYSELEDEKNRQLKSLEALHEVISIITKQGSLTDGKTPHHEKDSGTIYSAIQRMNNALPHIDKMYLVLEQQYKQYLSLPQRVAEGNMDFPGGIRKHLNDTAGSREIKNYCCIDFENGNGRLSDWEDKRKNWKSHHLVCKNIWFGSLFIGCQGGIRKKSDDKDFDFNDELLGSLAEEIAIAINNKKIELQKKRLFRDIAHSMREHLTPIALSAQRLYKGKVKEEKKKQYLKILYESTLGLNISLGEISGLVKLDSEKIIFRSSPIDIGGVVRTVIEENRFLLGAKGFSFETPGADNLFPVRGNLNRLKSAFQSLLNNAMKFASDRKVICITLLLDQSKESVLVKFTDEGIGIPENEIETVFDRFVRGQNAQIAKIDGTGIGLASAKYIFEQHNGSISVASQVGKGTTFTIQLPVFKKEDNNE